MARDLQENNVPAANQNRCDFFNLKDGSGVRVMFVGNSITKHGIKESIGWYNDCGMAASEEKCDYVHRLMEKISEKDNDAAFSVLQVANFEREFPVFDIEKEYKQAKKFAPDIVIMFFCANVNREYDAAENPKEKFKVTFGERYEELRNWLKVKDTTVIIHSQGFYSRPKLDSEKKNVADKYNDNWIELDDFSQTEEVRDPRFNHPNDLGMEKIADRFWDTIKNYL